MINNHYPFGTPFQTVFAFILESKLVESLTHIKNSVNKLHIS